MGVPISSPSPLEPPRAIRPPQRGRAPIIIPQPVMPRPRPLPQPVKRTERVIASSNTVNVITPQTSSVSVEQPSNYKYNLIYVEQGDKKQNFNVLTPKDPNLNIRYTLISNNPDYPKINLNKGFIAYFRSNQGQTNRFHVSNIVFTG